MANNYTIFSEMLLISGKEEREWLERLIEQLENGDEEGPDAAFVKEYSNNFHGNYLGFDAKFEDEGLWIYTEESGNVDAVAAFVQYFLERFHPDKYWTLTWACTCSKPRVGEFDGGAILVTAKDIKFNNSYLWLEKAKARYKSKTALGGKNGP